MFDSKTVQAYKKIKPSPELRERILAAEAPEGRSARILTLRRYGNLAACFVLMAVLALFAGRLLTADPNYAALADGSVLGAEPVTVQSVTASYTAAHVSFAREGGEETTYPTPVQAEGCFYFALHAKGLAYIETGDGSVFLYDEDPDAYVDCGSTAFFEDACRIYWYLPETEPGRTYTLTFTDEQTILTLTLSCENGVYTVSAAEETR